MATVEREGATIYYERCGSGSAVVFAHGAGGNRLSWWQQVPHFAERHSVITLDQRSYGRSACDAGAFHPSHFPGDLLAVLDAEEIERAALVCQSMGGWTGLPTALRHSERVSCLVLASTPGGLLTPELLKFMAETGERIRRDSGIDANAALAPDYPARRPDMAFLYAGISGLNTGADPANLARMAEPEARITPDDLAGYETPTLVLSGSHDLLFPPESLRIVASLIPGAELVPVEGAGHSIYFEMPELFNRVVGEFVAKHAS